MHFTKCYEKSLAKPRVGRDFQARGAAPAPSCRAENKVWGTRTHPLLLPRVLGKQHRADWRRFKPSPKPHPFSGAFLPARLSLQAWVHRSDLRCREWPWASPWPQAAQAGAGTPSRQDPKPTEAQARLCKINVSASAIGPLGRTCPAPEEQTNAREGPRLPLV